MSVTVAECRLLRAVLAHLSTLAPRHSFVSHLTSLDPVPDSKVPHVLCRYGEFGNLPIVLTQRFDVNAEGGVSEAYSDIDGEDISKVVENELTPFALLDAGVRFAMADAECEWETADKLMTDNCSAYGIVGRQAIVKAKMSWMKELREAGKPAYRLSRFTCDPANRFVTFGFECVTPGKEGRGTDLLYLDENCLVDKVYCVRHLKNQPQWALKQFTS